MAELISKVVRSANRVDDRSSDANHESKGTHIQSMLQQKAYFPGTLETGNEIRSKTAESEAPMSSGENYLGEGIIKTITTMIETESVDDSDDRSSQDTTVQVSVV